MASKSTAAKGRRPGRIARPSYPVPQSKEEANRVLEEIGRLQETLARIAAAADVAITTAKTSAAEQAKPVDDDLKARCASLHAFCEANRPGLTGGLKIKTVRFGAGTCSWRNSPGKVTIKGVADVLARLKTLGRNYKKFIRVKEEIDRDAMLKDAKRANLVEGVTIKGGEIFAIKPTATKIEALL